MTKRDAVTMLFGVFLSVLGTATVWSQGDGVVQDEHSPLPTCETKTLDDQVEKLIGPVLKLLVERKKNPNAEPKYEEALYRLLDSKDPRRVEAIVALMGYYVGEHYGEELLWAVQKDRSQAGPLITEYQVCRPRTTFEEELDGVIVLRTLYLMFE